ncbi:AAA family ATPase [Pseudalkalibacillus decolorationis]|uniref:AAA family ATPase n=1 Tax=Pseudalkalibacillus decolorationis TaxID=163879 RepID=UPI0021481961|nr:AAA family ATPase [Pseudalkalibacillus decolorationis]
MNHPFVFICDKTALKEYGDLYDIMMAIVYAGGVNEMQTNKKDCNQVKSIVQSFQDKKNIGQHGEIALLKLLHEVEEQSETLTTSEHKGEFLHLKAQILALLVKVQFERLGKIDATMRNRLIRAVSLSPKDSFVNETVSKLFIYDLEEWIKPITFPIIRETDNVASKRKAASEVVNVAVEALNGEKWLNKIINDGQKAAEIIENNDLIKQYKEVSDQGKRLLGDLTRLSNAAEEYRSSLSGSFHPSKLQTEIKELIKSVEEIQSKWNQSSQTGVRQKSSALVQLNEMIGMDEVRFRVHQLYNYLQFQKMREQKGFKMKDEPSLNMILTGNPGTGKTTIARLLSSIYHELGILPRAEVVEVDRSNLVGAYVGQTEENTMRVIETALGGILFIDEAYSLKREGSSGNDYGQTVIDTLVSAMTSGEYAGKFAVILAGYPEEMRHFLWSNPGLRSRFPESNHIYLPNYSIEELLSIAEKVAFDNDYTFTEDALNQLSERIESLRVDDTFGNARTVRDLVLDVIFQKGANTSLEDELTFHDYTVIKKEDIPGIGSDSEDGPDIKLSHLVGLDEIKQEVRALSSFVQVQHERREQSLPTVPLQLHSVFVGNPGTGKTTVASIYAKILREKGFLKRGHLVIAGRSDLVAGYSGQTALKTRKKIRESLGGVLFIDEAYSLFSGAANDFGKEVIHTLVEEMTKHNENLVVILAGYPSEIKQLLSSNPGLASRFKKYFYFNDYTTDELIEIMKRYSDLYNYEWEKGIESFLQNELINRKVTGNGRFAIDLINNAIQQQAFRITDVENGKNNRVITLLTIDDFNNAIKQSN